jgi:hypothetical protein
VGPRPLGHFRASTAWHRARAEERAEDELRSRGFTSLWFDTGIDEGYAAARALYEEMGYRRASGEFVISARIPADVESDRAWVDIVFQMSKRLDVPR